MKWQGLLSGREEENLRNKKNVSSQNLKGHNVRATIYSEELPLFARAYKA